MSARPRLPASAGALVRAHNAFIRAFHNGVLHTDGERRVYIRCVPCPTSVESAQEAEGGPVLFLRFGFGAHVFCLSLADMPFAARLRELCAPWALDDLPEVWARAALRHVLEEGTRAFIAQEPLRLLEINLSPRTAQADTKPLRRALDIVMEGEGRTLERRLILHTDADFPFMELSEKLGVARAEKLWPPRLTMRFPLHIGHTRLAPALLADLRAGDVVFVD